mgnify:CR=1 FL=1
MIMPGEFAKVKTALEHISDSLNTTLTQINQSSEQVASGSDQVASGSQALSQGATEQASSELRSLPQPSTTYHSK